jgi:hypothetical protein
MRLLDLGPIPAFARQVFLEETGVFFSIGGEQRAHPAPPNGVRASSREEDPEQGEAHREKQPTNQRP